MNIFLKNHYIFVIFASLFCFAEFSTLFGSAESVDEDDLPSACSMKKTILKKLEQTVKDRNRLRLWVTYYESKMRKLDENRMWLKHLENRMDCALPGVIGDVRKRLSKLYSNVSDLAFGEACAKKDYWYIGKSNVHLTAICLIVSSIVGYLSGKIGRVVAGECDMCGEFLKQIGSFDRWMNDSLSPYLGENNHED